MKFLLGFFMGLLNTIMLFVGGIIGAIIYDKLLFETRSHSYAQKPKPAPTYQPYEWTKPWTWRDDDKKENE